ncbi:MAG: hypothetical protein HPY67_08050 [Syntrophaceae bacterium]|nr:hypothetical protein [Syntrophaceae bacterium]
MTKNRRGKNRQSQTHTPKIKSQKSSQKQLPEKQLFLTGFYPTWNRVWGFFGPILTIVGLYFSFFPSIAVIPGSQMDPSNPFSIPFEIQNPNQYAITNVRVAFEATHFEAENEQGGKIILFNSIFLDTPLIPKILSKGRVQCFFNNSSILIMKPKVLMGTIKIKIKYDPPWFYFGEKSLEQKYDAYITQEGRLYWIESISH